MGYALKTNYPSKPAEQHFAYAPLLIKAHNEIPDGWQVSIEYAGCEIYHGMKGDSKPPTTDGLIKGACNINGVD